MLSQTLSLFPLRSHLPVLPAFPLAIAVRLLAVPPLSQGCARLTSLLPVLFPLCDALVSDSCVVSSLPSLKSLLTSLSHQGISRACWGKGPLWSFLLLPPISKFSHRLDYHLILQPLSSAFYKIISSLEFDT